MFHSTVGLHSAATEQPPCVLQGCTLHPAFAQPMAMELVQGILAAASRKEKAQMRLRGAIFAHEQDPILLELADVVGSHALPSRHEVQETLQVVSLELEMADPTFSHVGADGLLLWHAWRLRRIARHARRFLLGPQAGTHDSKLQRMFKRIQELEQELQSSQETPNEGTPEEDFFDEVANALFPEMEVEGPPQEEMEDLEGPPQEEMENQPMGPPHEEMENQQGPPQEELKNEPTGAAEDPVAEPEVHVATTPPAEPTVAEEPRAAGGDAPPPEPREGAAN